MGFWNLISPKKFEYLAQKFFIKKNSLLDTFT